MGWLFLVALAVAAVAAGMAVWGRRAPEFRLPDGTTVRVRSIRCAPEHFSPFDPLPRRILRILPASLRKRLPSAAAVGAPSHAAYSVGCWLEFDRVPDLIRTNGSGVGAGTALAVYAHDGRSFAVHPDLQVSGALPGGGYFEAGFLPAPASGDTEVQLDFHLRPDSPWSDPRQGAEPVFTWRGRVKGVRDVPVVPGDPLPVTRSDGDLTVTLTNLSVGVVPHQAWQRGWAGVQAGMRIDGPGGPDTAWEVIGFRHFSDSSGTTLSGQTWEHRGGWMWWKNHFWPDSAWTMRFEIARTNGFEPGEMATFEDLDPAAPGEASRTVATGTLTIREFRHVSPDRYELKVDFQPVRKPARLRVVRAVDPEGRILHPSSATWSETESTFHLRGDRAAPAAPLDLTLALQWTREVEFVVKPDVAPVPVRPVER